MNKYIICQYSPFRTGPMASCVCSVRRFCWIMRWRPDLLLRGSRGQATRTAPSAQPPAVPGTAPCLARGQYSTVGIIIRIIIRIIMRIPLPLPPPNVEPPGIISGSKMQGPQGGFTFGEGLDIWLKSIIFWGGKSRCQKKIRLFPPEFCENASNSQQNCICFTRYTHVFAFKHDSVIFPALFSPRIQ